MRKAEFPKVVVRRQFEDISHRLNEKVRNEECVRPCYVRLIRQQWDQNHVCPKMKDCYVKLKKMNFDQYLASNVARKSEQEDRLPELKNCFVKLKRMDFSNYENQEVNRTTNNTENVISRGLCPSYKRIKDTDFVVDAFNYSNLEHVDHFFLTRCQIDNEIVRIPVDFKKKIYLSEVTGEILKKFTSVNPECLIPMPLNVSVKIDNVEVTALDAQKYPGYVMFLFKFPSGRCILYTGEFSPNPNLEEYSDFWNNHVDILYLNAKCATSKRSERNDNGFAELVDQCDDFIDQNQKLGTKCIIVYGSNNIFETKFWTKLAHDFRLKVFVDEHHRQLLDCMNDKETMDMLTSDKNDARLHILALDKLNSQSLLEYLNRFNQVYNLLAIQLGQYDTSIKIIYDRYPIKIIGLNYNERSSLEDLNRFINFLRPTDIITTTPF